MSEREKEKGKKKCVKVTGHLLILFWFSFSLYLSEYLWRKCLLIEGGEELLDGSRSSKRKQKPNRSRHYCVRRSISFDGERECSTLTQSDRCRFWGQSAIKMLSRDLYTISTTMVYYTAVWLSWAQIRMGIWDILSSILYEGFVLSSTESDDGIYPLSSTCPLAF